MVMYFNTDTNNPNRTTLLTPQSDRGTVEDMYRTNLPNVQSALSQGREDYDQGFSRGVQSFDQGFSRGSDAFNAAYNDAIISLEEGYNRGETNTNKMLDEVRQRLSQYGEAGDQAVNQLAQAMGGDYEAFRASPGYQFRLNEGLKAVTNKASARGDTGAGGMGGRFGKELMRYGQDYASSEYDKWWGQVSGVADRGLQSQTVGTNALMTGSGQIGVLAGQTASGKARAAEHRGTGIGNLAQWAGTGKANLATWAAGGKAGLTERAAQFASGQGIAARAQDISNALTEEGMGIDWARLAEQPYTEERRAAIADKTREAIQKWEEEMADKGYSIWSDQMDERNKTGMINEIIKIVGGIFL